MPIIQPHDSQQTFLKSSPSYYFPYIPLLSPYMIPYIQRYISLHSPLAYAPLCIIL